MSLLGRLEDLSLPDIIQIVFLSRRTGILEIVDQGGRFTIVFQHGLVVDASSPRDPDLLSTLREIGAVDDSNALRLEQMYEEGAPVGFALLEMNAMTSQELGELVRRRIIGIVTPLLTSREGEFNFILSDTPSQFELQYDPEQVFREGGIPPQQIFGSPEGEKLKPLQGLEESMKAGKAMLSGNRSSGTSPAAPAPLRSQGGRSELQALDDLELPAESPPHLPAADPFAHDPIDEEIADDQMSIADLGREESPPPPPPARSPASDPPVDVELGDPFEAFFPSGEGPEPPLRPLDEEMSFDDTGSARRDKVAEPAVEREELPAGEELEHLPGVPADAFIAAPRTVETQSSEKAGETIVLYEPDPMLRVAARRAFTKKGFEFLQFGKLQDTREAVEELLADDRFFVTFLDLAGPSGNGGGSAALLDSIKEKGEHLPVVLIDADADLHRRHDLLGRGADFYLTKPSPAHLQPGLAEETLALFADELMMFAERSYASWKRRLGTLSDAARETQIAFAGKERTERGFALLKRLISELTTPDDLNQVADTILRMAHEYLTRGAIFAVTPDSFEGLGGFGSSGRGDEMSLRVRRITIGREETSVLADVAVSGTPHRGRLKRGEANEALIRALGVTSPTETVLLPISSRGSVVGIMYGDNAGTSDPIGDVSGLEIFLSQAGLAFESALIARSRAEGRGEQE
ncbi:MAG TPA: response regulator [Thermoanaerobaculia bacterium]|nr:response regulator [Thermoanaerobaculia bacterium]